MLSEIKKIIEKAIGDQAPNFSVEVPADQSHGDYATNAALILAKRTGRNPKEVALEIIASIDQHEFIEKMEVAGPGFINFYLTRNYFSEHLKSIDKNVGYGQHAKGWKVMIEHTQPNPFKVFHIGHFMNNAIGESVARIVKANGIS